MYSGSGSSGTVDAGEGKRGAMVLVATGLVRAGLDVGVRVVDDVWLEEWISSQKTDQKKLRTGCCTFCV